MIQDIEAGMKAFESRSNSASIDWFAELCTCKNEEMAADIAQATSRCYDIGAIIGQVQ